MSLIKTTDFINFIPIEQFFVCLIDNISLETISSLYTKEDINKKCGYTQLHKFVFHLKRVHNISLQEYCKKYLNINWPLCPTKKIEVGFKLKKNGVILNKFALGGITKETCPEFAAGCKKLSEDRIGEKNPMYGRRSWNRGLGLEDERVRKLAETRRGSKMSAEAKAKMSQRRKESTLKARHTTPHKPETIEILRKNTARLWAEGAFNRTTSIHLKMRKFLLSLDLIEPFTEEFQEVYYSLDFALPSSKVAIECDGDFYHCNPVFFPNGPKSPIQKRNAGRDKAKNTFLSNRGWIVLRFWECEINSGSFKEKLLCKLKELNLLKH